jgi:hypothetical protein
MMSFAVDLIWIMLAVAVIYAAMAAAAPAKLTRQGGPGPSGSATDPVASLTSLLILS